MTSKQTFSLFLSGVFFVVLYFGTDIRSDTQNIVDKKRNLESGLTIGSFLKQAKVDIPKNKLTFIEIQEQKLVDLDTDPERVLVLKDLASAWYQVGKPIVSGYYAEKIAKIVSDGETWSIAGKTYLFALQKTEDIQKRQYTWSHAIDAFENARSLDPESIEHKVNLALCYVENAPKDMPMKGILMLLDLNKKHPNNIGILLSLGRLGIKTNQLDKARKRLEKVLDLDPENNEANCLLLSIFEKMGNTEKYTEFMTRCK